MTDEEIEEKLYQLWRELEREAHFLADDADELFRIIRGRIKALREIEWKYKELCK